jgi:type II secretory pathway predicted ATPase ExeA
MPDLPDTGTYVKHHLSLAGRSDTLFSDDALAVIHQSSRGLPRAVKQARPPGPGQDLRSGQVHRR